MFCRVGRRERRPMSERKVALADGRNRVREAIDSQEAFSSPGYGSSSKG